MKFAVLASALSATAVFAASDPYCNEGACYGATHGYAATNIERYQRNLVDSCLATDAAVNGTGNLWGTKTCVAGAISYNWIWPETVLGLASCPNEQIACMADMPSLDYNVYASIVGDCAWQEGGCPITQQNFVDFIYGTLSDIGSGDWPSSTDTLLSEGWQPLLAWANSGETIPYTRFNDFLHSS